MQINKPRIPSSYSDSSTKASYLIAFNPEKLIHYGSASKKAMYLSSSDIDLIEPIPKSKSDELAKKMQAIVKNIDKAKITYLGDFKSGVDSYFVCDIGKIKGDSVEGFNKAAVTDFVQSRAFDEKTAILKLLKKPMNAERYMELKELMRKNQILRWSRKELLQGFKTVRGERINLSDTIKDTEAMTKIDTIQWIESESRFVEVTNYFKVGQTSGKDVNVSDYAESLKQDILKTYYSGNLFKMCKRILSYSLVTKDEATANNIYDIIHSGLGIMYQVIADIKAILYLHEHYKQLPKAHIKKMIDGFKPRLGSVYEFDFKEERIDKLIDASKSNIQRLYKLYDILYNILIGQTSKELRKRGLIPLPKKFLP